MLKRFFALVAMFATLIVSTTVFAFSIYYPADGIYSIQPKFAPDKELSVQNHASNWGANVIIDNINSGWQKWKIQRIPGTHFYSIVAVSSNLALDVANAQASDGANIATWPFLEGRQNQFAFFDAGGGYYAIKVNLDGNFVLDVERAENRAGANVLSWSFGGGDNQLWRLVMVRRLSEFQSYNKKATKKVTAYVMPDLQARSGNEWVDVGDDVAVLREEGNAYLVRYPVRGGTKTRWVNKNEIFSGSSPTPAPSPTPTSSGNWDSKVGQQLANIDSDSYTSANPFYPRYKRQCTWYAWGRMREVTGKSITFKPGARSYAKAWTTNTSNCSPCNLQSQCIAVRDFGGGGYGHVVFVEHVSTNYVYYTDDNANASTNLKVRKKTISEFKDLYQHFIR